MNTCLKNLYLNLNKIDSRYIRLVFMILALTSGIVVKGLPIHGDVGS
jgi:hypothetical protein